MTNINNVIFSDYLDTHDISINHDIHRTIEGHLNSGKFIGTRPRINDLLWGFGEKTILNNNEQSL